MLHKVNWSAQVSGESFQYSSISRKFSFKPQIFFLLFFRPIEYTYFGNVRQLQQLLAQCGKCPYLEFFQTVFSRIWTEYRDILRISPYSVRLWENIGQKNFVCFFGIKTLHVRFVKYLLHFEYVKIHRLCLIRGHTGIYERICFNYDNFSYFRLSIDYILL